MAYSDWGFSGNPFETTALPPNELGSSLFVGRSKQLKSLKTRLDASGKIPTVEGLNGVGKTSLVNICAYRAFRETLKTGVGPLYIPCRATFQLDEAFNTADFRAKVLMEIAQTLLERHSELPVRSGRTRPDSKTALDRYLNSPQIKSFSGGFGPIQAGYSSQTNTGYGFERSGFEKVVTDWLEEVFPTNTSGGVICVLDNLELLQTAARAQEVLEALRDPVLSIRGIRWILCGALGIIHGMASSPRLDGRLHKPVVVEDIEEESAGDVFDTRKKAFSTSHFSKLPLTRSQFIEIYDIMRGNLRSALSECDDFCMWVSDRVDDREEFTDSLFEVWLDEELEATFNAVRSHLKPAALRVFETACQFEVFAPNDCEYFGYKKPSAMRQQIRNLEAVGLLQSSIEEGDKRRKSIQVTSKGWKVRAYLDFFGD